MFNGLKLDWPYSTFHTGIGDSRCINYAINWELGYSIMFTEGSRFTAIKTTTAQSF